MSDMRIAKWHYLPLFLLLAALPLSGCRQMMKEAFKTPRVELAEVALDSDPSKGAGSPWRFLLTLNVDNPNPYPLNVARFAYTGMIGGEVVAEGEQVDERRIAASGVTTVKVPIALKPGAFETAARQVLTKKSLAWEFNGSVGLRTPLTGVVRIPFSKTGSYDLFYILKRMGIGLN
jgi:LEA14-like dessication related protein